ncbi:MAG: hypothetical protein JWN06_1545 [Propionibacteriaceae bacterium]|jgi:hypothetical protein|nr:hypothetical protein [Propionibacteriaceae bacterium]
MSRMISDTFMATDKSARYAVLNAGRVLPDGASASSPVSVELPLYRWRLRADDPVRLP